jgi:hypothetical protein
MANPFFSGRIPQSLYDRVEQYISESGKNKTELLISALSNYLDFPVEIKQTNSSNDELWIVVKKLQERMEKLEQGSISKDVIMSDNIDNTKIDTDPKQLSLLENNKEIVEENIKSLIEVEQKPEIQVVETNKAGKKIYREIVATEVIKISNINRKNINIFLGEAIEILKKEGKDIIPNGLIKEPIKINYKENIVIEEYPYEIFYAGENSKGKPVWNLIPDDNSN